MMPQLPTALVALAVDPELQNCRYRIVRKKFTDESFWRSYAYQVERIRGSSDPLTAPGGGVIESTNTASSKE